MSLHLTDERILLAGDWHGMLNQGKAAMNRAHDLGISTIIQVGDFGYWGDEATERTLNTWETFLERWDITLYFIDGNHENFHSLYKDYPLDTETGLRPLRKRIIHIPRGYLFTWNDLRILALGGAYSIDRNYRKENVSWWAEEEVTQEDISKSLKALNGETVDILLMHDSPAAVPNHITDNVGAQHMAGIQFGFNHLYNTGLHRESLDEVYFVAQPAILIHGHYHKYFVEPTLFGGVLCLDEGGSTLKKNTFILTPEIVEDFRAMRRLPE